MMSTLFLRIKDFEGKTAVVRPDAPLVRPDALSPKIQNR